MTARRAARAAPRPHAAQRLLARGYWRIRPGGRERVYRLLRESERLHPDELARLQLDAARELLSSARSIPFYRDRLRAASLEPEDLRMIGDLAVLPALERRELVEQGVHGLRGADGRGILRTTSGSTGAPVQALWGRTMLTWGAAVERRSLDWIGIPPGSRLDYIRGRPARERSWTAARARAAMRNSRLVDAGLATSPVTRPALVERLVQDPPTVISGPAPCLYLLGLALLEDGRTPAFQACLSHGSQLHEHYRRVIEAAFGCPVWERFGTVETGVIVHPCREESSLHMPAEVLYVELVRAGGSPAGAGEVGEILVTTLRNPAMPLIRYRTGDLAVRREDPCSCGRTLPMLERVIGRTPDLLVTSSGGLIAPADVVRSAVASAPEAVVDLEIAQREDLSLDVRIVLRNGVQTPDAIRCVADALDELVGIRGSARVEAVDALPLPASGKRRHVISEAHAAGVQPAGHDRR
jgi:phenylacetate-CoA ligase